jgi:hypothetical protein
VVAELRAELKWQLLFNDAKHGHLQCTILAVFEVKKEILDQLQMNYLRLGLAALGGMVAYFAFGFLLFWLVPSLIDEAHKYPAVFRAKEKIMTLMPIGMAATLIAILVVAIIFAMLHWHFRDLRICAAQLREPEHRAETRSGTGCGLLRPVDDRRHRHRSYLQTRRDTIIVNKSVVVLGGPPLHRHGGGYPIHRGFDGWAPRTPTSCAFVTTIGGWPTFAPGLA